MPTDSKLTVADYLETWLERREVDGLRPSTMVMYRSYVKNDIIPALGRLKLAELHRTDVDQFIRGLRSGTRGATTVHRIHSALSSAMRTAVQLHLIDSNPARDVQLPKRTRFRAATWEPEQANKFLAEVRSFRLGVVYEVAIRTGLRRGEVCGLRWQDVSFTDKELVVRVQLVEAGGAVTEGEIKTKSGQDRVVALDDALVDALAAWKLHQDDERELWGDAYQDSGRVFTYENGMELKPRYVARYFDTYTAKAGLPKIRFHDLRHLHASLLINAGIPLAVVSKRLGHSTIAVTVDLYGHLMRDANRDAAEAAAAMLLPRDQTAHTMPSQLP